jgi:hypothetical protein
MSNFFLTEMKGSPLDTLKNESVPFTRFLADWYMSGPASPQPFKSLFDKTVDMSNDMTDRAVDALMRSGPSRMHAGQTSAARLASGLSGSALRVPETRTGSLLAVSI